MIDDLLQKHWIRIFSIFALLFFILFVHWFSLYPHQLLMGPKPIYAPIVVETIKNVTSTNVHKANRKQYVLTQHRGYTIQLMGGSNMKALQTFVQLHSLTQKTRIIHAHYKNKNWYQLIYGHYATLQQARVVLNHLPVVLKIKHPWLRLEN